MSNEEFIEAAKKKAADIGATEFTLIDEPGAYGVRIRWRGHEWEESWVPTKGGEDRARHGILASLDRMKADPEKYLKAAGL